MGDPAEEHAPTTGQEWADSVDHARQLLKWNHDCASAMVVGGGSIALTLLLTGIPVRFEAFVALDVISALLVLGLAAGQLRVGSVLVPFLALDTLTAGGLPPLMRTAAGIWGPLDALELRFIAACAVLVETVVLSVLSTHWPIVADTPLWWSMVALALLVTYTGAKTRRETEVTIDALTAILEEIALRNLLATATGRSTSSSPSR